MNLTGEEFSTNWSAGSSWSGWNFHWITACDGRLSHTSGTDRNVSCCRRCSLACQSWWNRIVHWQSWDLQCLEIWVEGMVRMWWNVSFVVPFSTFSFQLDIQRLRLGFDHWSGPSQYGIVRKLHPIWFTFLGWLIDYTSSPYISMHFFHENNCPALSSIRKWVEVLELKFDQFFPNPGYEVLSFCLWELLEAMEGYLLWVSICTGVVHSSTIFHL